MIRKGKTGVSASMGMQMGATALRVSGQAIPK